MTAITQSPERAMLERLGLGLQRPRAILCISAHWETNGVTHLTAGDAPRTIHDFRGFPPELYAVRYEAPGAPWLVERAIDILQPHPAAADDSWGFDHGVWGVLSLLFPSESIPTVAMSLDRAVPPSSHLALGERLSALREEGVMIVGSGNIVHNLALYGATRGTVPAWADRFQARITCAVRDGNLAALTAFAPDDSDAAAAVNSAEHYLPLLYTVGARLPGDAVAAFNDTIDGSLSMTSYLIGDAEDVAAVQ